MATDRKVPDKYFTKDPEKIWNVWTTKQRAHFLYDHLSYGEEIEENLEFKEFHKLPDKIQTRLKQHIQMGRYNLGGSMDEGGEVRTQPSEITFFDIVFTLEHLVADEKLSTDQMDAILDKVNSNRIKLLEFEKIEGVTPEILEKIIRVSKTGYFADGGKISESDKRELWKRISKMKNRAWEKYTANTDSSKELLYLNRYEKYRQQEEDIKKELGYMSDGGNINGGGELVGNFEIEDVTPKGEMKKHFEWEKMWRVFEKGIGGRQVGTIVKDDSGYYFMPVIGKTSKHKSFEDIKLQLEKRTESNKMSEGGLIGIEVLHDTRFIQKALDAGRRYIFLSELTAPRHCYFTRSASVYNVDGKFLLYRNNLLDSKYYIQPQ